VSLEKNLTGLANAAGLAVVDGDGLPIVNLDPNVNHTARVLGQIVSRLDLFQMNGELVWFDEAGQMKPMTARVFRGWINEYVLVAEKYDGKKGTAIPTTMPVEYAATLIELPNFRRGVRVLRHVNRVRLPRVGENGELVKMPWGYDEVTQSYAVPGGLDYETDMDLAAAKMWWERYFSTMPFHEPLNYAVQMAACLALFVKHLPGGGSLRPGFLWRANKPGSGKSALAKASLYPVLGSAAAAKMKKNEELDKELEAFCRASVPYIFIDNVYGNMQSAAIDQLLTSEESTGRAMGGHGVFTAKNTPLLLVTGNELEMNEDALRRFLVVDLHEPGDPMERKISYPLDDSVMRGAEWRGKALSALWAMVAAWHEQGMPDGAITLPTFGEYSRLLGGIVAANGYEQPFQKPKVHELVAPEKAEFIELLALVLGEMGDAQEQDFTVEDLARLARAGKLFLDRVGTQEEGKRLAIKNDGVEKEQRAFVEDRGYMTPAQASSWGKRLKKEGGNHYKVQGRLLEFGKRGQGRKSTYTIRVIG
jgi:hypothetical protein